MFSKKAGRPRIQLCNLFAESSERVVGESHTKHLGLNSLSSCDHACMRALCNARVRARAHARGDYVHMRYLLSAMCVSTRAQKVVSRLPPPSLSPCLQMHSPSLTRKTSAPRLLEQTLDSPHCHHPSKRHPRHVICFLSWIRAHLSILTTLALF